MTAPEGVAAEVAVGTVVTSSATIAAWSVLFPRLRADALDEKGALLATELPIIALLPPRRAPAAFTLWASWCEPCLAEMPMLGELAAEGHRIAGVSMDSDLAKVRSTLRARKPRYPMGMLTRESSRSTGRALDAGLPFTVVLDARGDVSALIAGALDRELLTAALERARGHE